MALFSTISCCLWQRRNRLRENQPTWPLKEVGERAIVLVREFFDACKSDAGRVFLLLMCVGLVLQKVYIR